MLAKLKNRAEHGSILIELCYCPPIHLNACCYTPPFFNQILCASHNPTYCNMTNTKRNLYIRFYVFSRVRLKNFSIIFFSYSLENCR